MHFEADGLDTFDDRGDIDAAALAELVGRFDSVQ